MFFKSYTKQTLWEQGDRKIGNRDNHVYNREGVKKLIREKSQGTNQ